MQYEQALTVLTRLKDAAPPTASVRIGEVLALFRRLYDENDLLKATRGAQTRQRDALGLEDVFARANELLLPSLEDLYAQIATIRTGKLGRLNAEQVDALLLAEQLAQTSRTLIDSLDTLTRLRRGRLRFNIEPFSPVNLIQQAYQQVQERAEARGHRVILRMDDPLPTPVGDYERALAILIDLLDNAILYTSYGGVIRLTADTLGTHVLFSVEDNGVGLTMDDIHHVGEPFWRGIHQQLVRQHPGAGMRLHVARHVLALLGSELFFSGHTGEGSTFSFILPVARAQTSRLTASVNQAG